MTDQTPYEVVQPASYTTVSTSQNNNTALRVILIILLVLVLCCCCVFLLLFLGLWGVLSWLWNNGDSIFYLGQFLPLVL